MCGIVGFSGKSNYDISKIKMLMLSNIVRGTDSTGMYMNGKIIKDAISCEKFLSKNEIVESNLFIGHTRKATTTVVNKETAHPFQKGNIIGVHNGVIYNKYAIETILGLKNSDYSVDSELLIEAISQGKLKNVLEKLDGALALIWTDITTSKLFCMKNSERPLYRGMAEEGIYLSSLEESLLTIGISSDHIKQIPDDRIFVFNEGTIESNYSVPHSKTVRTTTYSSPSYSKSNSYSTGYNGSTYTNNYFNSNNIKAHDVVEVSTSHLVAPGLYYVIKNEGLFSEIYDYNMKKKVLVATSTLKKQPDLKINDFVKPLYYNPEWEESFGFKESDHFQIRGKETENGSLFIHCDLQRNNTSVIFPSYLLHKITPSQLQLPESSDSTALTENDSIPNAKYIYDQLVDIKSEFELTFMEMDSLQVFESDYFGGVKDSYKNALTKLDLLLTDICATEGEQ